MKILAITEEKEISRLHTMEKLKRVASQQMRCWRMRVWKKFGMEAGITDLLKNIEFVC